MDLRVLFLVLAGITFLLFTLRKGPILKPEDFGQIVVDFLLVLAVVGTVGSFVFLIARQDPRPLIRQAAYILSFNQLVSFEDAIPANLENNLKVEDVTRVDTDADGFKEWVVFYSYDLQSGRSPIKGAVYDTDRGNPPVIFPYSLRPPDRDYLSETGARLQLVDIIATGSEETTLPELLVWGDNTTLTIFAYNENSEAWDFPRDAPARYPPIGFFRGSGAVNFDADTNQVTVIDRDGYERSQLAIRSVYGLNPATNTYLDPFDPEKLAAPIISTVDFFSGPPFDIIDTAYPEKVVLGFYAASCNLVDDTLCRNADNVGIEPQALLAPGSEALTEFQNGNAGYFGLSSFAVDGLSVAAVRYFPALETDPDLLVTGGGRDVVTGEQAQYNIVDISFVVNGSPLQALRYAMVLVNGEWKILRRLPITEPVLEAAPIEVPPPLQ